MRVLIQRVARASVNVANDTVGQIGRGFLLLVGVTHDDTERQSTSLATKIANLRVFDDEAGDLNRSALDLLAESPESVGMLVVSQFTLYADARKGRRPSFVQAAPPAVASPLVDHFANQLRQLGLTVEQGIFGAEMQVELVNNGPVTIWLDTESLQSVTPRRRGFDGYAVGTVQDFLARELGLHARYTQRQLAADAPISRALWSLRWSERGKQPVDTRLIRRGNEPPKF